MNYKTHDQELLAIIMTFKHWRHYLKRGQHSIEVLFNYQNLQGFIKGKELNNRQVHWAIKLAAFDFIITYYSNKTNPVNRPSY